MSATTGARGDLTNTLTVIITCMGRLPHLQRSLPLIAGQPGLACVVVDYSCPQNCGNWVQAHFPGVLVVRSAGERFFSVAKARNLGARAVRTQWVCFMDADTLVGPDFGRSVTTALRPSCFLRPDHTAHELAGMVVCRLDDFDAIGGYDELFSGWGAEDRDLYARLRRSGLSAATFAASSVSFIAHGDDERTRHHAVTDRALAHRINALYLQIKTDLARLTEVTELGPKELHRIRQKVYRLVLENPAAAVKMEVQLPATADFVQPAGWQLRRSINFVFEALPTIPPS